MKKLAAYAGIILLLVPVQTTLLPHLAIWDIKPDLGLVTAALIGVLAGELHGLLIGLAVGWIFNLYSAGELWLNLVTTGGAGLFAGLLAKQVAEITPTIVSIGLMVLSLAGGLLAVFSMKHATMTDAWWMVQFVVLPEACYDAAVGAAVLSILEHRVALPRFGLLDRYS